MSLQTQFSQSDLVFRFVGGKNDGRLVPVATSKCMLGKDQSQNAKCAIYRSEKGTTVESMAGDVLMNGRTFDVNWLKVGDRITVGASVLEIVQVGNCEGVVEEQVLPVEVVVNSNETLVSLDAADEEVLSPLDCLSKEIEDQLALEDRETPPTEEGPSNNAASAGAESDARTQPCFDLDSAGDQSADSSNSNISVWELPASFSTGAKSSESQNLGTTNEGTETVERTETVEGTSEAAATPVSGSEPIAPAKGVTPEMEALSKRLFGAGEVSTEQTTESATEFAIETTAASLSDQLNSLMGSALKPDAVRDETSVEESSTDHVSEERESQEPSGAESLLEKYGLADSATDGETDAAPEGEAKASDESASSESVADLLARMQTNNGKERGVVDSDSKEVNLESLTNEEATTAGSPPEGVGENGDSVQDYMTGLLERLRGGPDDPAEKPKKKPEPKAKKVEVPVEKPVVKEAPVGLLTPDEFKPKAKAPERAESLDAMRELANEQVRKAIFVSQMKRRKAVTLTFFCIALGGLMLAGYSILTAKGFDVSFFVGIACVGISFGTGYKCLSTHLGWDLPTPKTNSIPRTPAGSETPVARERRTGADRRVEGERSVASDEVVNAGSEVALDGEGSP